MPYSSPADLPAPNGSDWIAPDCHGQNFYDIDHAMRSLLDIYLEPGIRAHMTPHYQRLGGIAGGRLDELSRLADRHDPVLHPRDAFGRDLDWVEFHPAYREMEQIGFGDFGIHCMSRRPGVLGWPDKVPPLAKYIFQYLFVQGEFGLMCPISVTDTSALLIERYGDDALKNKMLPGMMSQDLSAILKSAQFMTEKSGGSDASNLELTARLEGGEWRLYGEKWFCSCVDGDVALLLARPKGAPGGSRGLGLFALPRCLDDGARNRYRIVRLKEKLGTRSMASGEIIFDGALAYPLGKVGPNANFGLKQIMDQVSLSRLSHGVRAAAMMRRCLNESLVVARNRKAFGKTIIEHPLMRRQLMKIMLPTEQALSVFMFAATTMEQADGGDVDAALVQRIVTPLLKFRACRDNITVATAAMEARGGNGFIENWVNARLVRDAHVGVLWEGTSSINALDVTTRAIAKLGAQDALGGALQDKLDNCDALPGQYRGELSSAVGRAIAFAAEVAAKPEHEPLARQASNALYHAMSAVLMAVEGATLAANGGDARRLLLSRLVIEHHLSVRDPLAVGDVSQESQITVLLLDDRPVTRDQAAGLLTA